MIAIYYTKERSKIFESEMKNGNEAMRKAYEILKTTDVNHIILEMSTDEFPIEIIKHSEIIK